jgi:hypothetical protein
MCFPYNIPINQISSKLMCMNLHYHHNLFAYYNLMNIMHLVNQREALAITTLKSIEVVNKYGFVSLKTNLCFWKLFSNTSHQLCILQMSHARRLMHSKA